MVGWMHIHLNITLWNGISHHRLRWTKVYLYYIYSMYYIIIYQQKFHSTFLDIFFSRTSHFGFFFCLVNLLLHPDFFSSFSISLIPNALWCIKNEKWWNPADFFFSPSIIPNMFLNGFCCKSKGLCSSLAAFAVHRINISFTRCGFGSWDSLRLAKEMRMRAHVHISISYINLYMYICIYQSKRFSADLS